MRSFELQTKQGGDSAFGNVFSVFDDRMTHVAQFLMRTLLQMRRTVFVFKRIPDESHESKIPPRPPEQTAQVTVINVADLAENSSRRTADEASENSSNSRYALRFPW